MIANLRANAAYRKKLLAYLVTVLGVIVSVGVLHGKMLAVVTSVLAVLGGLGVHGLANGPEPTTPSS